jgi:hypothetical protein
MLGATVRRSHGACSERTRKPSAVAQPPRGCFIGADRQSMEDGRLAVVAARASTGMNVPPPCPMALRKLAPACPSGHGPASVRISAAGWICSMAAAASARPVSMIGKAPASPSASTRSADGLSATTTTGPNVAMTMCNLQRAMSALTLGSRR